MTRYSRKGTRLGKINTREVKPIKRTAQSKKQKTTIVIQEALFKRNKMEGFKRIRKIDDLMDDSFWGYQAAMADGDGCFERSRKPCYKLGLTDLGPVKQLADLYGSSISKRMFFSEDLSDTFITRLHGERALHFMLKVCPFLIEKRGLVIEMINEKIPNYHPPKIPMTLNTWDVHLGYVAGAMDSEGTLNCYPITFHSSGCLGPYMKTFMRITNTNIRFLKKIQKFLTTLPFKWTTKDIPIRARPSKQKKDNGEFCKTAYDIEFNRKSQTIMAALLQPFLQIKRKRNNIDKFLLLRDVDNMISKGKKYPNIKVLKTKLGTNQVG